MREERKIDEIIVLNGQFMELIIIAFNVITM